MIFSVFSLLEEDHEFISIVIKEVRFCLQNIFDVIPKLFGLLDNFLSVILQIFSPWLVLLIGVVRVVLILFWFHFLRGGVLFILKAFATIEEIVFLKLLRIGALF